VNLTGKGRGNIVDTTEKRKYLFDRHRACPTLAFNQYEVTWATCRYIDLMLMTRFPLPKILLSVFDLRGYTLDTFIE